MKRRNLPSLWLVVPGAFLVAIAFWSLRSCSPPEAKSPAAATANPRNLRTEATQRPDFETWNQRFSKQLPPPPQLRPLAENGTGVLPNGLRYVVLRHAENPGEVSLRLQIRAGSIHETDDERGFAHFVEHLAFAPTDRRPDGNALEAFQRFGVKMGADSNAHTAVDHTRYCLDLPLADDEALEVAFGFLRDVADGIRFDPEEVEKERAVILRELSEREKHQAFALRSAALFKGVRAAERLPIGLKEVVETATPEKLRAFWQKHYVAPRMTLVIVGDLHEAETIARIQRHFGSLPACPAPPAPLSGNPLGDRRPSLDFIPHDDFDGIRVTLAAPQPIETPPDSPEERRLEVVESVALRMLQNRLGRRFERARILGVQPQVKRVELMPGISWLEIVSETSKGREPAVIYRMLAEYHRVLAHGFERAEFAEARWMVRQSIRQNFARRMSSSTSTLADELNEGLHRGRRPESPRDELNRSLTDLAALDALECLTWLQSACNHAAPRMALSGEVDENDKSFLEMFIAEASKPQEPLAPSASVAPLYIEPFPQPGLISSRKLYDSNGYVEALFANKVLVRLAPMPSMGGHVEVRVDAGYGKHSIPPDKPGLALAADLNGSWYPMGKWRQLPMRAALAEEDVSIRFECQGDAFSWSGSTHRDELRRQLELLCACTTKPGAIEPDHSWKPTESILVTLQSYIDSRYSTFFQAMTRAITGNDPRFELQPIGFMERNAEELATWMKSDLEDSRLRIIITGDFEPQQALDDIAATFGALPMRQAWDAPAAYPDLSLPLEGLQRVPSARNSKVASTNLAIPLPLPRDADDQLTREIYFSILKQRLFSQIREEAGESYSPTATLMQPSDADSPWLVIQVPCAPGREEELAVQLREILQCLAVDGWSHDEANRAIRPILFSYQRLRHHPHHFAEFLTDPKLLPSPAELQESQLHRLLPKVRELATYLTEKEPVELRVEASE